ncbi:protease serine 40 [Cricetulus griseus]
MRGIRAQQYGGYGASLLAALLWLSLLPQHAQAADPASNTSAINTSTTETMGTTPPLSESKEARAIVTPKSHNPKDYQVRIGYTKMSSPTKYSREMSVYKLIVHKDYDRFHRQGSDIVLMQLESPVEYSSHILPACVPDKNIKLPKEKACWASGWGNLREDVRLPLPDDLQEVKLILMDNEDCKMFFPKPAPGNTRSYYIYDDMMCAADYSMTKSICSGDSGGPFVCLLEGSWYVVGLTSWSSSCETPITTPSVFARVSYFDNWIKEHKLASPDPKPWEPGRPPYNPNDPGGGYHWNNNKDKGTVIKPMMCMALLSSWVLLLQMILLRNL